MLQEMMFRGSTDTNLYLCTAVVWVAWRVGDYLFCFVKTEKFSQKNIVLFRSESSTLFMALIVSFRTNLRNVFSQVQFNGILLQLCFLILLRICLLIILHVKCSINKSLYFVSVTLLPTFFKDFVLLIHLSALCFRTTTFMQLLVMYMIICLKYRPR